MMGLIRRSYTYLEHLFNAYSIPDPADSDAFKTSSGRLKKVTTSYDQDIWKKTSILQRLEDV